MKTHKQRTKSQIIDTFMEEVEQSQQIPTSISDFCLINHIEEENFNAYFDSIKALEAEIYAIFFQNTLELLRTDEAYLQFEAKEKVLTFYYTFFEILNANNVYVKTSLTNKNVFSKILVFKTLRESYTQYIKTLQHDYLTIPLEVLENAKSNLIATLAWEKLLLILNYWLKDESEGKEKTDILIEKSVQTIFELANTKPLASVFDLGKFIYNERFKQK